MSASYAPYFIAVSYTHLDVYKRQGINNQLRCGEKCCLAITIVLSLYIYEIGRAHVKHTEGGDFRQATYRAIRPGLKSTESVLLEPYYSFILQVPME